MNQGMKRLPAWLVALLGVVLGVVVLGAFVLVPQWIYPPLSSSSVNAVADMRIRIELQQAQYQLQNDLRSILLQGLAGALVVVGAAATWRQVHLARDGQIADRFSRAIEQLGSDNPDLQIGGIYALERIIVSSPEYRPTIQFVLGSFVRRHAPWPAGSPPGPEHRTPTVDPDMLWLTVRRPEIQAAMSVLGRRRPTPRTPRLYLPRVDLRGARLAGANLAGTQLEHSNLAGAWLEKTNLAGTDLKCADLRQAHAVGATFVGAVLRSAHLEGADLRGADLRGADLRGADMRAQHLNDATLTDVLTDLQTRWPPGFRQTSSIA